MVNARRRKNETASSLYLSLHIRWGRVGKRRLAAFLR